MFKNYFKIVDRIKVKVLFDVGFLLVSDIFIFFCLKKLLKLCCVLCKSKNIEIMKICRMRNLFKYFLVYI